MSMEQRLNFERPTRHTIMLDDLDRPKKIVRHSLQPVVTYDPLRHSWEDSQEYSLSLFMNPDVSISLLLGDDDSFEYDIINIDVELMQAMEMSLIDLRPTVKISSRTTLPSGEKLPRYSVRQRSSHSKY